MAKSKNLLPLMLMLVAALQIIGIAGVAFLFLSIGSNVETDGINYPLWTGAGFLALTIFPILAIIYRRLRPIGSIILLIILPLISALSRIFFWS